MEYVILIIIGVAMIMILVGMAIRPYKLNKGLSIDKSGIKMTMLQQIAEKCTNLPLVGKIAKWLTDNRSNPMIKMSNKLLELSEVTLSLYQLYVIKITSIVLAFLVIISINFTNIQYQKDYIIQGSTAALQMGVPEANVISKLEPKSRKILYEDILIIAQHNNTASLRAEIVRILGVDNNTALVYEDWYKQVKIGVDSLKILNSGDFILLLIASFGWDLLLIIIWVLRGYARKQEIIRLEYVFQQLSNVEGVRTTEIIQELVAASKVYKKQLSNFYQIFISDKRRAFIELKGVGENTSLCKLAEVLEIYSLNDHQVALEILDRAILERDEAALITAEETLDFVDIFAFISIAPLVYEIARLMLSPMLELIYKAFEYM